MWCLVGIFKISWNSDFSIKAGFILPDVSIHPVRFGL